MRQRFHGRTYFTFQQCENAMRAEKINIWLDEGKRVFGDDGPDEPGKLFEVEEALEPKSHGILVRTKCGQYVTIFSMKAYDPDQVLEIKDGTP